MLPLDFQETSTLKLSKDDASVEFQRWISYSKYESIQKLIDVIDSIRNKMKSICLFNEISIE